MPTIGFFEILLIGVVALLVLGPEKLPGAIRTTSLWVGRARRSFNKVKSDIERELNSDEIRRQLHNESILADIDDAKTKARALADETRRDLDRLSQEVDESVKDITTLKKLAENNPALLDEEPAPIQSDAGQDEGDELQQIPPPAPQNAEAVERTPPQDFYNDPGVGVIELRDGKFQPAQTDTSADDAGKTGKQ